MIHNSSISDLINDLQLDNKNDRPLTAIDHVATLRKLVESGALTTLEPLLPLALQLQGKPYTLKNHYPFSPLFKTDMPKNIVVKSGRQLSKCLVGGCYVLLNSGERKEIQNLKIGDEILSVDLEDNKIVINTVIDTINSGSRECVKIKTRTGRVIKVALTHPLLKLNGWTAAENLKVKDRIALTKQGGFFHNISVPRERIILTAYLIGDGCITKDINFTSGCEEALQEFQQQLFNLEGQLHKFTTKKTSYAKKIRAFAGPTSQLRQWLEQDKLYGKHSYEKHIPNWVFQLSKEDTALFISRLWATDGMIKTDRSRPQISYCSTSECLTRDLQSLLLKFNIPTSIHQRATGYKKEGVYHKCRDAYILRVETREGWENFMSTFIVPGKPSIELQDTISNNNKATAPIEVGELIGEIVGECRGRWSKKASLDSIDLRKKPKYPPTYNKLQRYLDFLREHYSNHPKLPELEKLVDGDIVWDEIVEIKHIGLQPCYDIEVNNTHNYLVEGIVSHNSTSLAAHGVLLSNCIPHFRQLYITPLYEQIRRFSNNYVRPFIELSPIKNLWTDTTTENSVLQRSFKNRSIMIFSFAFLDANRIRGISADACNIDEIQDFDIDHLAVIREVLSYSNYGIMKFTGTPKSLDNAAEGLWQKSSMAEWVIKCGECGYHNIPSKDHDLDNMIGPYSEDISEKRPGTICIRCKNPVYPRTGRWIHRYPDRREKMSGYHIPQIIMPLHFARPDKWSELLAKREGWGNMTVNEFYNEVLGESIDVGQKLVTETELKKASNLPFENTPNDPSPELIKRLPHYKTKVLACDWSGGGEMEVSFTVLTLLGLKSDGKIDCLWGKKLIISTDHLSEAKQCLHWARAFNVDCFAHDYTGAGIVRETVMVQAGFNLEKVMPVQYVRAASNNIIRYVPPTPIHSRAHYRLDKTRSLLYTCQAIKLGLLNFFKYDYRDTENPGLIADFLALVEEKTESRSAGDIYVIKRNIMRSDDFAQAVNIGCAALWHINDAWPNFADSAAVANITQEMAKAAGHADYGWKEDRMGGGFFDSPYI